MHGHDDEETTSVDADAGRCGECQARGFHYSGCSKFGNETDEELRARVLGAASPEDCAGCKRGGKCAIHGSARKRKSAGAKAKAAASSAEPADLATELPATYEQALALERIRPSKRNPRKRKPSKAEMAELAESIRVHGVIVPIEVRYRPDGGTDYEITYGECRWTASNMAGRTTIPAKVVECSDDVAFERRILENLQRKDVHPLDEAEGFRAMRDSGRDVDYIAHKTGKSKSWVYARLKLAELPELASEALAGDRMSASIALLIARIPSTTHQEWATREVLRMRPHDFMDAANDEEEKTGVPTPEEIHEHLGRLQDLYDQAPRVLNPETNQETEESVPMSVREAQVHLQRYFMTRLELAKFPLDDAQLVPAAGACTKCVHRTGNQRELFADVKRADVCTNPPCFEKKTRAAFERLTSELDESIKVIPQEETGNIFNHHDRSLVNGNSPYVEPDAPVPWELLPGGTATRPTWEKLLGKKGLAQVERVVAQDKTGGAHQLITKAAAVKVLREAGKLPKPAEKKAASNSGSTATKNTDKARAQREAKEALAKGVVDKILAGAGEKVAKLKDGVFMRQLAIAVGYYVEMGDGLETLERFAAAAGVKPGKGARAGEKTIESLISKAKTGAEFETLIVQMVIADHFDAYHAGINKEGERFLQVLGFDWKKMMAAEADAAKAAVAKNKKDAKGKCGAVNPATGFLCTEPPDHVWGHGHPGPKGDDGIPVRVPWAGQGLGLKKGAPKR